MKLTPNPPINSTLMLNIEIRGNPIVTTVVNQGHVFVQFQFVHDIGIKHSNEYPQCMFL